MGNITISLQISFSLTCNKYRLLKFTKHLKNKLNSLCEKKKLNKYAISLLVKSKGNVTAGIPFLSDLNDTLCKSYLYKNLGEWYN